MEPRKYEYSYASTESMVDRMDREYDEMVARDKEAAVNDELVGRYLKESAADGYAYYVIESVNADGSLVVERQDIYDGWSVPMYEGMSDCFPRKYALQNIASRESMEALMKTYKAKK